MDTWKGMDNMAKEGVREMRARRGNMTKGGKGDRKDSGDGRGSGKDGDGKGGKGGNGGQRLKKGKGGKKGKKSYVDMDMDMWKDMDNMIKEGVREMRARMGNMTEEEMEEMVKDKRGNMTKG